MCEGSAVTTGTEVSRVSLLYEWSRKQSLTTVLTFFHQHAQLGCEHCHRPSLLSPLFPYPSGSHDSLFLAPSGSHDPLFLAPSGSQDPLLSPPSLISSSSLPCPCLQSLRTLHDCRLYGPKSDPSEMHRVQEAGGWIDDGRVCDILAVSRAFGDCEFKGEGLPIMLKKGVE